MVLITPDHQTGWVRTSPSTALPTIFRAYVDDPTQRFTLDFEVRTTSGRRPEVTSLTLEIRNVSTSGSITTEALRQVPVSAALKLALAGATKPVLDQGDGTFAFPDDPSGAVWGADHVARPVRGTPMSQEFLQLVAATYRAAVASGSRSPVEDLRVQLGASRSTAGRWVVRAREAGLLGRAIGRTPGEVVPKRSRNTRRGS